mgnify:CR=1 FL=1
MFAHISLGVTDLENSVTFYDTIMPKLGYNRLFGSLEENFMAYGPEESFFIICTPLNENGPSAQSCNGTHICLNALTKESVDQFYKTALKNGASDGGAPGIRPHYAENYYACFIFDPDGHKIEAMVKT